jgi:hypothetical protein
VKTEFYGIKAAGYLTFFMVFELVNKSNKYFPTFKVGGYSDADIGPFHF